MSKYLLDKAITVTVAVTVLALETRNMKSESLNCHPGRPVFLWSDVGDFNRFRQRQSFQIENQSRAQINQSTEEKALIHAQY